MKNKHFFNLKKYILDLISCLLLLIIIYLSIIIFNYLNLFKIVLIVIDVLIPLIIGLLIAYLLEPILKYCDRLKIKRKYSSTIVYLFITIIIFLIVYFLIPNIFKQVEMFYEIVPEITNKINNILEKMNINLNILLNVFQSFGTVVVIFSSKIITSLAKLGIGLGTAFFISLDFNFVKSFLMKMPPNKYKSITKRIVNYSGIIIFKYIKGMMIDTIILFSLATISFYLLGFEYFYIYAIIIAITNLIPFIGAWIGGIPIVIVSLLTSMQLAIIVIIVMMVLQYLESTFIQPMILKGVIKLHPIVEVMALIFFGGLFGIIGMIASPVLAVIIKYIYLELNDGHIPNQ